MKPETKSDVCEKCGSKMKYIISSDCYEEPWISRECSNGCGKLSTEPSDAYNLYDVIVRQSALKALFDAAKEASK